MSRLEPHRGLLPSLLDRLLDPHCLQGDPPVFPLHRLLESVRSDLEELLNTRRPGVQPSRDFVELQRSILTYGMPDLQAYDTSLPGAQDLLARLIESVITRFEPRLRNVRASWKEQGRAGGQQVCVHIEAQLRVEPANSVSFETILELRTGQASIRSSTG